MEYKISIRDQLATQLRSFRRVRHLSQTDLAYKLGISQSRVAAIERNQSAVSIGQIFDFLQALNVDLILRDSLQSDKVNQRTDTVSKGEW